MKRIIASVLALALMPGTAAFAQGEEARFSEIEAKIPALRQLLSRCDELGLDVSYERADFAVIRDFIDYGREDISMGDADRAEYVADCLEKLCDTTQGKLESYIDGSKTPVAVPKKAYGGAADGNFVGEDGAAIFLNGYGAFDKVKNDVGKLGEFGADIIQFEIGPSSVLVPPGSINGWSVKTYGDADADARLDGSSLKIVNNSASGDGRYIAVRQSVAVRPETAYTLSFDARATNCGRAFVSANGWSADRIYIKSGTSQTSTYTGSYMTGADEYSVEILIVSSSAAEGIWLDNFRLCEQDTEENIIQNGDFESSDCIESEHFAASTAQIRNRVVRTLDSAYKNGIAVNLLISPHYFPQWILDAYPDAAAPDCGLGYDINNEIIREALRLYIGALMGEIAEHPALHSICITNEPKCDTRKCEGLGGEFSQYLQGVYGSIDRLNAVYRSAYATFAEVPMPQTDSYDAAYYDWICFNNERMKSLHGFLADTVHEFAPKVAVHAKIMTVFGRNDYRNLGIDPEDIAEVCDYSGNDAWGFLGADASGLISKLMWYDLLSSIKPSAPVINSEDHIIEDRNENYSPKQALHAGADIWQGAIHGRDASVIWVWGRTADKTANTYGNILYRPDVLSEVSRRSLDLDRLAEYAAAAQAAVPEISILYSPTAAAYNSDARAVTAKAYEAALYSGVKAEFITERQLAAGKLPCGVLVAPQTSNICDAAFEAAAEYKRSGGKIVAIGECFGYDEHNQPRAARFTPYAAVGSAVGTEELSQLLCDAAGGSRIGYGVEKFEFEYGGDRFINVCNYSWDNTAVLPLDTPATDLISGKRYSGAVTAEPFCPMLLRYDAPKFSLDAYGRYENGTYSVFAQITNTGTVGGYADVSFVLDAGGVWHKADAHKLVPAGESAELEFSVTAQGGSNSAEVRLYTGARLADKAVVND